MTKSYRPEGWENEYNKTCSKGGRKASRYFEAGATAMLEALRESGERCDEWGNTIEEPYGTMVFIPDDEPENEESSL